jgi:hypothetical protein
VKPGIKNMERVQALELYKKQELIHREIVPECLRKLENKKELNENVGKFVENMITLRANLQRYFCCIVMLEETNRKLGAKVANSIPPP